MSAISTLDNYIDDFAGTDTTSFSDADKHAAQTRWAHTITEEVIDAQGDWDFQGETATANLVANQREYAFPTDILKIKRIDLKLDGTNWTPVHWLDESEIPNSAASESDITENFNNSNPYITLYDKSFFVWSGTITSVTGGIKIWYSEEIVGVDDSGDDISSFTADTDSSNLAEFAQMGLVFGPILDWCENRNPGLANRMNIRLYGHSAGRPANNDEVGGLIGRIRTFYSQRVPDKKVAITSSSKLEDYE